MHGWLRPGTDSEDQPFQYQFDVIPFLQHANKFLDREVCADYNNMLEKVI